MSINKSVVLESIQTKQKQEPKVLYYGVFLDENESRKLLEATKEYIPSNWKTYAHHMTLLFIGKEPNAEIQTFAESNIGATANLTGTQIGIDENNAIAVRVDPGLIPVSNNIPHITIATPIDGKPVNSNYITNWIDIPHIDIVGTIDAQMSNGRKKSNNIN